MCMTMERVLVSGATGFIGSHLVRKLMADGVAVHAILRPTSDESILAGLGDGPTIHRHDGTDAKLRAIVSAAAPDVVFHLAAHFVAEHVADDIELLIANNLLFATQLTDAVAQAGARRFVNVGTAWQHDVDGAVRPVNLYAATKQAFEALLRYYVETGELCVITLKLFDSYGPNDPRAKLFTLLRAAGANGKRLALSPGKQLVDLVYVDDIVEALIGAGHRLMAGEDVNMESYAVSSGAPVSLKVLVDIYSRITGFALDIDWGGRSYRAREVMVPWRTGEPLPGWAPRTTLEDGIRRMEADPV